MAEIDRELVDVALSSAILRARTEGCFRDRLAILRRALVAAPARASMSSFALLPASIDLHYLRRLPGPEADVCLPRIGLQAILTPAFEYAYFSRLRRE